MGHHIPRQRPQRRASLRRWLLEADQVEDLREHRAQQQAEMEKQAQQMAMAEGASKLGGVKEDSIVGKALSRRPEWLRAMTAPPDGNYVNEEGENTRQRPGAERTAHCNAYHVTLTAVLKVSWSSMTSLTPSELTYQPFLVRPRVRVTISNTIPTTPQSETVSEASTST